MADALTKVRPGQPLRIPAAAYNAFVDAAKATRGVTQDTARDAQREQTRFLAPVKNNSGAAVPRFGVLGVDGPLFDPVEAPEGFRRRVALRGVAPAEEEHLGRFVVALEPIAPGAIGMACAAGLCAVQVEFPEDPPDGRERKFADIAGGSTANLKASDRGAATILWREPGTGVKWAIVRLGGLAESHLFPVRLTLAGGQQGTALEAASWIYDIAGAITDEVLASGVDPTAPPHNWRRPEVGLVAPAAFGAAHFDTDGALVLDWINEAARPRWAFPILLTQTGGEQGAPAMPASWTYSVIDAVSGLTLSTDTDPAASPHQWKRPPRGKVEPATFGYASLTAGGVMIIGWINEVPEIPASLAFPVTLVIAEQVTGTKEAPTNHSYNVFDAATGEPLGEFVNPGAAPHQWRRPEIGALAPATFALAFRDAAGALVITWTNETLTADPCGETQQQA